MTEKSPCETNDKKSSSWNFDELQTEDESNNSDDFFSVLKKSVTKHVYADEEDMNEKNFLSKKQQSTIRVDSSDLISRCKHFLPILTDENRKLFSKIQSGENVRIELDSDQDDERTIEMDVMFCPNVESSTDEEEDDDKQVIKKTKQVNIIEIQSDNKSNENS